uniref:Uncharacterized protein n=1 Tax=Coccolithus braarudii TaxID=221442 RepID=A0A7S0Q0P0_9EUKA
MSTNPATPRRLVVIVFPSVVPTILSLAPHFCLRLIALPLLPDLSLSQPLPALRSAAGVAIHSHPFSAIRAIQLKIDGDTGRRPPAQSWVTLVVLRLLLSLLVARPHQ